MPDDCIGEWRNSIRVPDGGEVKSDPGIFRFFDDAGTLKGEHIVGSQTLPLTDVSCRPESGTIHHILAFTRHDGSFMCSYEGRVVLIDPHGACIIFRGRYQSNETAFQDNGDWTAEKPVV